MSGNYQVRFCEGLRAKYRGLLTKRLKLYGSDGAGITGAIHQTTAGSRLIFRPQNVAPVKSLLVV